MNILIVYSHPSKKSYTNQILEQLQNALQSQQWHVEISDLYDIDFKSDMSEMEYERAGLGLMYHPLPNDVVSEQKKIDKADCIIFIYPVWWSDCPAKLKGWFDRVFSLGYAYGHDPKVQKMKVVKYGLVLCTAGHSNTVLEESGISHSMQNVMLDDRLGNRFQHKEMIVLDGTLQMDLVSDLHENIIASLPAKIQRYCSSNFTASSN